MNDIAIRHDAQQQRFDTEADGHAAHLEYRRHGDVLTITHTRVPEAIGGRGIAAHLVRAALEHARAEGLKVAPACSYAAVFMQRHGEYADLLE